MNDQGRITLPLSEKGHVGCFCGIVGLGILRSRGSCGPVRAAELAAHL